MGREQTEVKAQSEQLLEGPLKHARAAALAAALVPLASVAAAPAVAQDFCSGGTQVGNYVWYDTNNNGVQDAGESGIGNAVVSLEFLSSGDPTMASGTDESGFYQFRDLCPGSYRILVQIPNGMQPSPAYAGGNAAQDSDGVADGVGNSVAEVTVPEFGFVVNDVIDFGFWQAPVQQPGTGTPGYWKNHPEAWPVSEITVGGRTYTRDEAIAWMWTSGSDKTLTMFNSLVSAMLNVKIGNDGNCVASTIESANTWMATYGPVGSRVHASSLAWKRGEPMHRLMDNYNNGMLCAPHRN